MYKYEHVNNSEYLKINGYPLISPYGLVRPLKLYEYEAFMKYTTFLKKTTKNIKGLLLSEMIKSTDNKENIKSFRDLLMNNEAVKFIHQNYFGLKDFIMSLIDLAFIDEKLSSEIIFINVTKNDVEWNKFRKFILSFNGVVIKDESGDTEIQRFNNLSNALKESKGDMINFESMFSTIMASSGYSPETINNFTLYQFHTLFYRITTVKNYETSVLFKTVDSKGSVKITSWAKPKEDKLKNNEFVKLTSLSTNEKI